MRRLGGGQRFDPNLYGQGTLKAWFKADSLALADGASVSTWLDSSANGNNATAGTAPTFKVGVQNGKPGVLFVRASNQKLNAAGLAAVSNGADLPRTVTVAFNLTGGTANLQHICSWSNSGVAAPQDRCYVDSGLYRQNRRDDASTTSIISSGAATAVATAQVVTWKFDGTDGSIYLNGALIAGPTSQAAPGTMTINQFQLGILFSNSANSTPLDGHIFELFVYASSLSDADRQAVERAMGSKWGIAIT
jgi:hypothetical protein